MRYSWIPTMLLALVGAALSGSAVEPSEPDFRLQAITLVGPPEQIPEKPVVTELADAALPEALSRFLVPTVSRNPSMDPSRFGLPPLLTFLDAFTFDLKASDIRKRSKKTWNNFLVWSTVEIWLRKWTPDKLELEVKVKYDGFKSERVKVSGSPHRTQLVEFPMTGDDSSRSLFVALTPVRSIPLFQTADRPTGDPQPSHPVPTEMPGPPYPPDVPETRTPARVTFSGIVTAEGRLAADRFVFLNCPHPAFADPAFWTITREWKFEPGRLAQQPVNVLATFEVTFRMR